MVSLVWMLNMESVRSSPEALARMPAEGQNQPLASASARLAPSMARLARVPQNVIQRALPSPTSGSGQASPPKPPSGCGLQPAARLTLPPFVTLFGEIGEKEGELVNAEVPQKGGNPRFSAG